MSFAPADRGANDRELCEKDIELAREEKIQALKEAREELEEKFEGKLEQAKAEGRAEAFKEVGEWAEGNIRSSCTSGDGCSKRPLHEGQCIWTFDEFDPYNQALSDLQAFIRSKSGERK